MINVIGLKELANELSESEVGKYSDSFNYVLFLKKMKDGNLKSYQMCVQEIDEEKDIYVSGYDLFTQDVNETWDLEDFDGYSENEEVYVISDVVEEC